MIAASRLAEVDRELEAFGVETSKLEALLASLRQQKFTAEEVEAFLAGAPDVAAPFVERVSSDAIAIDFEEPTPATEEVVVAAEAAAEAPEVEAPTPELPVEEASDLEALEAAAPSQEIELDEDVVVPQRTARTSEPVLSVAADDDDTDFPFDGTELIASGARELELEFDGDLSVGSEPIHFETPATGTNRPAARPSRAPLSQADLDAELAAILNDPDDSEVPPRQSLIDVDVEMTSGDVDLSDVVEASSDSTDVTDVVDGAVTSTSTRPPPLPARPSSIAPPPDPSPGFLGRLLNKK